MEIRFLIHRDISKDILSHICRLKDESWPHGVAEQEKWIRENINDEDIHVLIYDENIHLIGYTNLVKRQLVFNNTKNFLGIGNVCVAKKIEKSGVGKYMMVGINDYLVTNNTIGLLFCKEALLGFYKKCNWTLLEGNIIEADYELENIYAMIFNVKNVSSLRLMGNSF
jgi:hypothetical protein